MYVPHQTLYSRVCFAERARALRSDRRRPAEPSVTFLHARVTRLLSPSVARHTLIRQSPLLTMRSLFRHLALLHSSNGRARSPTDGPVPLLEGLLGIGAIDVSPPATRTPDHGEERTVHVNHAINSKMPECLRQLHLGRRLREPLLSHTPETGSVLTASASATQCRSAPAQCLTSPWTFCSRGRALDQASGPAALRCLPANRHGTPVDPR
ncbi:hypothetical protein DFH11DRAFT_864682 [Phellopilus nigrolimitatus]|nr:hypothetical protein DFH11DRAFT_864682 [Phellopilus nigrolimitatus]